MKWKEREEMRRSKVDASERERERERRRAKRGEKPRFAR